MNGNIDTAAVKITPICIKDDAKNAVPERFALDATMVNNAPITAIAGTIQSTGISA